jgi:hypothetical protein
MTMNDATPPSNNPSDRPDRVDHYLSRKAQTRLDRGAVVFERGNGEWILTVPNRSPIALGGSFGRAKQALAALISAADGKK